jgi:hypothetical protein
VEDVTLFEDLVVLLGTEEVAEGMFFLVGNIGVTQGIYNI